MFRNLENLFEKKKRLMSNSENITIKTTGIVNLFLKDHFKHSPQNKLFNIGYTQKDKTLLIEAGNKILANELSLRLTDLYDQFKKEGIQLAKILIR